MSRALVLAALLAAAGPLAAQSAGDPATALASYVEKSDDSYAWDVHARFERNGAEIVELRLTSQTWREIPWRHQLFLIKPAGVDATSTQGMLMVGGGRWREELDASAPEDADTPRALPESADQFIQIAEMLGSVMAVVLQVPFQPLYGGLTEDRLIAYTFEQYLADGDPEWPLLLPMVKSAVRAMDTTQAFAARDWGIDLDAFTVMGGSKRGWTAWLTAAVDERVAAFVPMVIDVLNFPEHIPHQTAKWGRPSESISPYTDLGLEDVLASEEGEALRQIVDPYNYLDALTQPKLIVIGTNDPYFPLDSLNLYWSEVREPKYALYLPNNTHSLRDFGRLLPTLRQLHRHAADGEPMAELDWEYRNDDESVTLCMRTDVDPRAVRVWLAESEGLDFRDATWTPQRLDRAGEDGGWQFTLDEPPSGYVALFGEAAFGAGAPYYLSTAVQIVGPQVPGRRPVGENGICP